MIALLAFSKFTFNLLTNAIERGQAKYRVEIAKYKSKIANERNKMNSEFQKRLMAKEKEIHSRNQKEREKLKALKSIINSDMTSDASDTENQDSNVRTVSDPNLSALVAHNTRSRSRRLSSSPRRSIAVTNPKTHRRSKSTDAEKWLDHRPRI